MQIEISLQSSMREQINFFTEQVLPCQYRHGNTYSVKKTDIYV